MRNGVGGLLLSAIVPLAGCMGGPEPPRRTYTDVLEAYRSHSGTSAIYVINVDQAFELARAVFKWNEAESIEEHPEDHEIFAHFTGVGSAFCGAWIDRIDEQHSKVTAVTKRRTFIQLFSALTESGFHSDFQRGIDFLRMAGSVSPTRPP